MSDNWTLRDCLVCRGQDLRGGYLLSKTDVFFSFRLTMMTVLLFKLLQNNSWKTPDYSSNIFCELFVRQGVSILMNSVQISIFYWLVEFELQESFLSICSSFTKIRLFWTTCLKLSSWNSQTWHFWCLAFVQQWQTICRSSHFDFREY